MSSVESVQNWRWPVCPTAAGVAVSVYPTDGVSPSPTHTNVYPAFVPLASTGSSRQAFVEDVPAHVVPPIDASVAGNPKLEYVEVYVTAAVLIARVDPTADASLAAILLLRKFGMAIAAIIRMIETTISNSIKLNPFRFSIWCPPGSIRDLFERGTRPQYIAECIPLHARFRFGHTSPALHDLSYV